MGGTIKVKIIIENPLLLIAKNFTNLTKIRNEVTLDKISSFFWCVSRIYNTLISYDVQKN